MISFELDNTREGLNIYLNKEGIDELIKCLIYIGKEKDHMHLLAGNELSEKSIDQNSSLIKYVKIGYLDE